jgi:hypothetical protein
MLVRRISKCRPTLGIGSVPMLNPCSEPCSTRPPGMLLPCPSLSPPHETLRDRITARAALKHPFILAHSSRRVRLPPPSSSLPSLPPAALHWSRWRHALHGIVKSQEVCPTSAPPSLLTILPSHPTEPLQKQQASPSDLPSPHPPLLPGDEEG